MDPMLFGWLILMIGGFAGSALYSGLETGAYSLNRVRLQVLDHQNDARARLLRAEITRPVVLLSMLLIGNNLANYLGTAGMVVVLEHFGLTDTQVILLNVLIVTPILFVFGETLPKDLFSTYADQLMYRLAPVLRVSRWLFWPLLIAVVGFSRMINWFYRDSRTLHTMHPRRQMSALVKEGVAEGLLSDEQSAMVERVLSMAERRLHDEMVPWAQVRRIGADTDVGKIRTLAEKTGLSRFPVVNERGAAVGVINVFEMLLRDDLDGQQARDLMTAPLMLDERMPIRRALRQLQASHQQFAIVTRSRRPVGVVTVKDLVEPITGELLEW